MSKMYTFSLVLCIVWLFCTLPEQFTFAWYQGKLFYGSLDVYVSWYSPYNANNSVRAQYIFYSFK